jgi:hypothetical protein
MEDQHNPSVAGPVGKPKGACLPPSSSLLSPSPAGQGSATTTTTAFTIVTPTDGSNLTGAGTSKRPRLPVTVNPTTSTQLSNQQQHASKRKNSLLGKEKQELEEGAVDETMPSMVARVRVMLPGFYGTQEGASEEIGL